jgi:hypothetical protein
MKMTKCIQRPFFLHQRGICGGIICGMCIPLHGITARRHGHLGSRHTRAPSSKLEQPGTWGGFPGRMYIELRDVAFEKNND